METLYSWSAFSRGSVLLSNDVDHIAYHTQVEDCLFNVHRTFLQTCADSVFSTMFTLPLSEHRKGEGSNDDEPITLTLVSVQEFESLLRILYRPYVLGREPKLDRT